MTNTAEFSPSGYDAYQLIQSVSDRIQSLADSDYRLVGGYPTAIMMDDGTSFDLATRTTKAGGSPLDIFRTNGTKKDLDYVLMTEDGEHARHVEQELNDEFRGFGHTISIDRLRPPGPRRLGFVGSQAIDYQTGQAFMQLGPVQQEVPAETLEAWYIAMPEGETVQVWHPLTQLMMYEARSITGIRHKDREKHAELRERLLAVDELTADYDNYDHWMEYIKAVAELDLKNVLPLRGKSPIVALNGLAKSIMIWGESKKEIVEAFQRDSGIVDRIQRWGINR
jgi:hypothetical protein